MYHFRFLYEPKIARKEKRNSFSYFLYCIIALMNLYFLQLTFSDIYQLKSLDNQSVLSEKKSLAHVNEGQSRNKDATFIGFKTYLKDFETTIPFERMNFQMSQIDIHAKAEDNDCYFAQVETFESNQKYRVIGLTPLEKTEKGYQYKIRIEVIKDE